MHSINIMKRLTNQNTGFATADKVQIYWSKNYARMVLSVSKDV